MKKCKKEIKVLFFDHATVMGGAEFSLLDILTGMKKGPVKTVLLAPKQGKLYSLAMANGIESVDFPFSQGILSVKRTDIEKRPLLIIKGIPEIMRAVFFIRRVLRRNDYSVIYTNTLKSHLLGGLAGKLAGCKVVWHFRDIPVQNVSRFIILLGARLFPNKIVTVSRATAVQFGKVKSKTTIIHNGLDIQRIQSLANQKIPKENEAKLKDDGKRCMVGIVGQISRWKGHDIFLRAAKIILKKYPETRFLIIGGSIFGEDSFKEDLYRYIRENKLDNKIIFIEHLTNVYPLMKRLCLLANCSIEPEPFGRVIIEAMSLGIPVVATSGGAAEEIIDDGLDGLIVPPGNPEALAGAMEKILADSDRKNAFITKGSVKISDNFGLDMMLKRVTDIIVGETD